MFVRLRRALAAVVAAPAVLAAQGSPVVHRGALGSGDAQLRSGEYYDSYSFEGRSGQRVAFDLRSSVFDPYVMVIAPSGDKKENDDWQGSNRHARIELTLEETGTYRVVVTSYAKDETGAYELRIEAGGTTVAAGGGGAGSDARVESGRLEAGDQTLRSGEYLDTYPFEGRRGETITVDLRSTDFDPYLIVIDPDDQQTENDDHEGDARRSLVTLVLPRDGTYRVIVTSYRAGETGAYTVNILRGTGTGGGAVATGGAGAGAPRVERGRLAAGDDTLRSGEYVDIYRFDGVPGRRASIDVVSQDFDTYLILIPPRGDRQENDDVEGRPRHSLIEADLTEPGSYTVAVTSYQRGETGDYELRIDFESGAATTTSASGANRSSGDVENLGYGDTRNGQLTTSDRRLQGGEYRDLYTFEGRSGDQVVVELASADFDPYLALIPPEGEQIDNDDWEGRQDLSRIELTLRASGRYRVMATSYAADKTGAYRLSLRRGAAPAPAVAARPAAPAPATGGAGRVYGVFVGISNYGGRASNLMFTAQDAQRAHEAMVRGAGMRESDGIVLTDQQATLGNIRRAVADVAGRAGPNDLFVFFYSGHGGRVPRQGGFQPSDPDGQDETLAFYDADLIDDDMAEWLSAIRARTTLLILDACFSGGFSKDVISAPGRMGLFSSEEDVTSGVAVKFRAGGYLAQFMLEAVGDRLADADGDREITALELSQYLHERYRADVKSAGPGEDFVRTGGPQTGYQHLVVDRGSVGPFDVLFR
jgi:hypothetical protein